MLKILRRSRKSLKILVRFALGRHLPAPHARLPRSRSEGLAGAGGPATPLPLASSTCREAASLPYGSGVRSFGI